MPPDHDLHQVVIDLRDDEASALPTQRVRVDGRHLQRHGLPFRVKGVTYGTFGPRADGALFPDPGALRADLEHVAALGLNTIRTYTLPPVDLLDVAAELDLQVLVGLDYEDWRMHAGSGRTVHRKVLDAGNRAVDAALQRLAGRNNVLAVSVGNEVPGDLVRLHGVRPVERTLSALVERLHRGDPDLAVTYSSFPTTEYLHVDGLDIASFNVFLEDPDRLRAYLRHLRAITGDRPLLITELGLAARIHGVERQAESLDEQLTVVDEVGCAGATVFAWTDEWVVAGEPVDGWGFGITATDRSPKPAVAAVSQWAKRDIRELRQQWPSVSVVVCAYNEERLLGECLDSLMDVDYPGFEVIVCDDGSTDATLQIASGYPFTVLALPHGGLSRARNAGLQAASGDIVAYLDADAHCHPEWPYHLALSLEDPGVVATGGPNLPVAAAGFVERAVAASPGGPVEVLIGDDRAEHVPGCNMAFVRSELLAVGGFDPMYTSAGDDVDVCWTLLDRGHEIAFSPSAQVRHHRRSAVRGYLRQQLGYGRSERMVAARHPHRFNRLGQARWSGAIYGGLRTLPSLLRPVVYHGSHGSAPYQPVQARPAEAIFGWLAALLPLGLPVAAVGLLLSSASRWWLVVPAVVAAVVTAYVAVVFAAARRAAVGRRRLRWQALVAFLHFAQPFVRTWGRLRRGPAPAARSVPDEPAEWAGDRLAWIAALERRLVTARTIVRHGPPGARWDISASVGPLLQARVATAVQWSWTPCARVTVAPRWAGITAAATACAAALLAGVALPVVAAIVATTVIVERLTLMRRVRHALATTTAGARG